MTKNYFVFLTHSGPYMKTDMQNQNCDLRILSVTGSVHHYSKYLGLKFINFQLAYQILSATLTTLNKGLYAV